LLPEYSPPNYSGPCLPELAGLEGLVSLAWLPTHFHTHRLAKRRMSATGPAYQDATGEKGTSCREGPILSCPVMLQEVRNSVLVRVANLTDLWETVGMTNQPTAQQQRPQHREDHKIQKLMERVELKLAPQAKTIRESNQASSKN